MANSLVGLLIAMCLTQHGVAGFPTGPPAVESVCVELKPAFYSPHIFHNGNGTFRITTNALTSDDGRYFTYEASQSYSGK